MQSTRRAAAAALLLLLAAGSRCDAAEGGGGWAPWYRSCLDRAGEQRLLEAEADTTLYAEETRNSNGEGLYLYAGRRDTRIHPGSNRRALVRFPTPGRDGAEPLPDGAVLTAVELTLTMSDTGTGGVQVALHRVLAPWGEGDSSGDGSSGEEGGAGVLAQPGDATWTVRRVEGERAQGPLWAEPGGKLAAETSAEAEVSSVGPYTWSGPDLVADYAGWLAGNATNHGWAVVVNDGGAQSVKRFNSRQNPVSPPSLLLRYRVPAHDCAGEPPAPPAWAGGGAYAEGCAGSSAGQACELRCEPGRTPSDPEGACCRGGVWQVATCELPCGAAQLRAAVGPAADTTLREDRPDEAGGADGVLGVAATGGAAARALLRFDLGETPGNGVDRRWLEVRRAELRLRAASGEGGDDGPSVSAHAVGAAWTEASATWRSRENGTAWPEPGGGQDVAGQNASASGAVDESGTATLRGAGLAADVARWLGSPEGEGDNHGWALLHEAGHPVTAQNLSSREAGDQYARPRLVACYLNGPCHNGVVDAAASEMCDPGEAVLAGCSGRCEVEPGHGCATLAGGATFACAPLSGGSTGVFDAGLSNDTAVEATVHVVDHAAGVANFVTRVTAPPAVGAVHPSLRLEVLKGSAVEGPDEGWTGMSFAVALAPGAAAGDGAAKAVLGLGVRVPSVHCSPHLGLYELSGGKWVDAASACAGAGAKALRADCWLSGTLCARNGTYALRKDTGGGDPTGESGGGDDDDSSHHTFVIVMASLGAVFAAGTAFACWVWCSTRYRATYKYQEDVPATTLTNVNRASLVGDRDATAAEA